MDIEQVFTLKSVLLYIIKNSRPDRRDVYSIVKTAYFAQQIHLAEFGSPLFEDKIAALPFGPVPSAMYDILKIARGDVSVLGFKSKQILAFASSAIGFSDERFSAKEQPDMDYLSASDIKALDASIKKVSKLSFEDMKTATHGKEWERAYRSKDKTLDTVAVAREGGACEAMLAYMKSNIELQAALG